MKYTKLIISVIIVCLVLFIILLVIKLNKQTQTNRTITNNYIALTDSVKQYKTMINNLEVQVSEKAALLISKEDAIKINLITIEEYKKLNFKSINTITNLKLEISILKDSLTHSGTIVYLDTNKQKPAILLPFNFSDTTNKYYSFKGQFNNKGVMSYSFGLTPITLNLYGGIDKKSKQLKITSTVDNPYVNIIDINSTNILVKSSNKFSIGPFIGGGLTSEFKFTPVVGVGLMYNLIKF